MSLLEDPGVKAISSPLKSTSISSDAYILSLAALPEFYAASASAPSNAIHLFDKSTLSCGQTLAGHAMATTSLQIADRLSSTSRQILVSSGKDGSVKAWDERSNSVALESQWF
jgi:WD40 repeat protein